MNVLQKYTKTENESLSNADIEIKALIKNASSLNMIMENWEEKKGELDATLELNRQLWVFFASAMQDPSSHQSVEIRTNIVNLAMFVFKKTLEIMVEPKPESLKILIDINMNIAKGLQEASKQASVNPAPNPVSTSDTAQSTQEVVVDEQEEKENETPKDEYGDIFGG